MSLLMLVKLLTRHARLRTKFLTLQCDSLTPPSRPCSVGLLLIPLMFTSVVLLMGPMTSGKLTL